MTLRDVLQNTRLIVKIGTVNGGGWLFVGRPSDMLENAEEYEVLRLERLEKGIKACYRYRDSKKWMRKADRIRKYMEEALPLLDRQVREVYASQSSIDITQCILVDGNEIGGYWMLSEVGESSVAFKGVTMKVDYGEV
jgi:hypothetical protein